MSGEPLPRMEGPYKGLVPFAEEDFALFFGRESDREVILANLFGSRLTVLYGASGVGKSSVLQAGVAHKVRQLGRENRKEHGAPELALTVFSAWRDDPWQGLLKATQAAVEAAWGGRAWEQPVSAEASLAEALKIWAGRLAGDLLIILDQFEEYFLYHPGGTDSERFDVELARAINQPGLRVNFLISIREDALAGLDRFKGKIPGLFENYLRLEHLDREQARSAIRGPVEKYGGHSIEPDLVEEVLDQVAVGRVAVGESGQGAASAERSDERIEAPYLQLVMSRLWEEEERSGSTVLRKATLETLGGATRIVQTHLDNTLSAFSLEQQEIAARIFRYLVTPRGTKIALAVVDLADFTGVEAARIQPVLDRLARSDVRILRPPGDGGRYEIFHDVLGAGVLDWRRRFLRQLERRDSELLLARERKRNLRLGLGIAGLGVLLVAVLALAVWALRQREEAREQSRLATSSRLATQSLNYLENHLDLALLLSTQANRVADTLESRFALLKALQAQPQLVAYLRGYTAEVTVVAASADGHLLAAACEDGTVHFWSSARQGSYAYSAPLIRVPHRATVTKIAFSPDGRTLAVLTEDHRLTLWMIPGRTRQEISEGEDVHGLEFSPTDGTLALGRTGEVVLLDPHGSRPRQVIRTNLKDAIQDLSFSSDGKTLAFSDAQKSYFWDMSRQAPELGSSFAATVFDRSGRFIATKMELKDETTLITLRDRKDGRVIEMWLAPADARISFTSDDELMVNSPKDSFIIGHHEEKSGPGPLAGYSRTWISDRLALTVDKEGVKLWTSLKHKRSLTASLPSEWLKRNKINSSSLPGRQSWPRGKDANLPITGDRSLDVAFSPDGKVVATLDSVDIRLWSTASPRPFGFPLATAAGAPFKPTGRLLFSADGKSLAYVEGDSSGLLIDVDPESWRARACAVANRNLSLEEWTLFIGSDTPCDRTCPDLPSCQ